MNRDDSDGANLDRERERHGDPAITPERDPNRTMSEPDIERARGAEPARDNEESVTDGERDADEKLESNPPRTTTGSWFTAPKFGSAGSGGAEFEPPTKKP